MDLIVFYFYSDMSRWAKKKKKESYIPLWPKVLQFDLKYNLTCDPIGYDTIQDKLNLSLNPK